MILPTKHLGEERALITIGSVILNSINKPKSVSRVWNELSEKNNNSNELVRITYDWYVLALDFLFIINAIELQDGLLRKLCHD